MSRSRWPLLVALVTGAAIGVLGVRASVWHGVIAGLGSALFVHFVLGGGLADQLRRRQPGARAMPLALVGLTVAVLGAAVHAAFQWQPYTAVWLWAGPALALIGAYLLINRGR